MRTPNIRPVGLLGLALLMLAGGVHASAPLDQYAFFGPEDDVIRDLHTDLVWQRDVVGPFTHDNAVSECQHGEWRLPTVKELLTIVDEETYGAYENGMIVYRPIDRNAFPATPRDKFWTSSCLDVSSEKHCWVVNFADGSTSKESAEAVTSSFFVRCVRRWQ